MKEKPNGISGAETAPEEIEVKRQRSMKFNLYSNRPRTSSREPVATIPLSPISSRPPQIPPPLPLSSSRGSSLPSPISPTPRPSTSHHSSSTDPYRSFTAQHNPYQRPSEASRLRALNNGNRSRSTEGRRTPDIYGTTDNFSRPRQPSIKRKNGSPKPLIHGGTAFPLQSHDEDQISTDFEGYDMRDRGISVSSSQSATGPSSITLRPSTSIPDYQTADSIYSKQRNLTSPNHKGGRILSRPDSNYSSHRREPFQRPAGFDGEEVRASFRSALTTNSSFLGTSGTERSSVMTKSSPATSIFGRDEGMSVDDAIGMYEDGFVDSEVEDDHEPRPTTSNSEAMEKENQDRGFKLSEAINDTLALPPSTFTIRDSTAIFQAGSADASSNETADNFDGAVDVKEGYYAQTPLRRPVTSAVKSEYDSTRDRYGFRKKSQNVSLAQYEAWNGPYTEHLARRKKKWVALLKENGLISDHPTRFPRSAKVKRFVRKGLPPDWRGNAWFYYAGGPAMMSKNYGVFDDLIKRAANGEVSETDDEIIERDLNRTFPDNIKFKPDPSPETESKDSSRPDVEPETPIVKSLRRVLQAFSIYNPKIGYCQSLNFLAGLLLLFMDEERSFWMLNIITGVYLPGTHELNLEGANVDLGVLMTSIKESMPSIWAKIGGELDGSAGDGKVSMRLPPITLCTTAWFMSCFIGTLPIETTLRVWDSFFYEGSKTLFRIALAIFKVGEQEIKAVSDPMEIFQVVQTIPRRLIDANALMEACFKRRNGFGHLTQETIEKRRAERRAGYADERARANGEIPLSRKGTLFSRKKSKHSEI
ncbi:hypothetical protein B7494_g4656 [Chlorociboria aeruginascens]|nr:hypothetical protein B7494_g4656 [Chlorociboria aeruginascens]